MINRLMDGWTDQPTNRTTDRASHIVACKRQKNMHLQKKHSFKEDASFYSKMEIVYTCQELSNFDIVVWWSKLGLTDEALELAPYKDRCPQSLREKVCAGVQKDIHTCK